MQANSALMTCWFYYSTLDMSDNKSNLINSFSEH